MMSGEVLSRHRLPQPYRVALAVLWLTPPALLTLTLLVGHGATFNLLDLRFLLPVLLMVFPALYIWQEGVDVLHEGLRARIHVPRYYAYDRLGAWQIKAYRDTRLLIVWDCHQRKVLECHAGHLTDLPSLLNALQRNVRRHGSESS